MVGVLLVGVGEVFSSAFAVGAKEVSSAAILHFPDQRM